MKTYYLILILFSFISVICFSQDDQISEYYYYKGEKIPLKINKKRLAIYFEEDSAFQKQLGNQFELRRITSQMDKYSKKEKKIICL